MRKASYIACKAVMNERIRATGGDHGMPIRSSMFWRICGPRPSSNRPPENADRSHAA